MRFKTSPAPGFARRGVWPARALRARGASFKLINDHSEALFPTLFTYYRVAGQLKKGEGLPSNLHEIAVGLILGDAHIYRNKTENASMHIEQSIIHKEYLYHLYNLFLDYCKSREEVVDLLLDQGAAARPLRLLL